MATRFEEIDWYESPRWYDLLFDVGTEREAEFLEAMAERWGRPRGRRAFEPACGSGRLLRELAERGWSVTGFDASAPMLAFAGERLAARGLEATLLEARMEEFRLRGRFDLAFCLVSTFKYLLDEASARSHLEHVARHLRAGGIYVLGFHLTDSGRLSRERERWVARRDGAAVTCNIQAWPPDRRRRRERVRSRLVVREHGRERRLETTWDFRTYDAREARSLLRSVPELEHVATHDFHFDPAEPRELDDSRADCVLVLRRRVAPRPRRA